MSIDVSPWVARLERLPLFGLTVAVLYGALFLKYIHDVDMYWQLEFGSIIANTGRWPEYEPFLHGKEAVRNVPICWLSQWIYFEIWNLGGWPLLQLVEGAIWLGGYVAVANALRKRGHWAWPAALALLYGFLPSYTFASIRPQSFALLGFGLTMALTWSDWKLWKKLLAGSSMFVIWQNAHPSVLMAGVWLGPMTIGGVIRWWRGGRAFPYEMCGLSALAVAAAFCCPMPLETFELARSNEVMSKYLDVSEWMPLWWPPDNPNAIMDPESRGSAALAILILIILLVARGRRYPVEEIVAAVGLAVLTTQMYRFAVFLGFALIPLAYRTFQPAGEPEPLSKYWKRWLIGAFAVAMVISLTRFTVASLIRPERTFVDPQMDYFPFEAVRAMEATVPAGTVYCNFFWGGVVVRGNQPKWKVSHDGRYYHFTKDEWDRYWAGMTQVDAVGHRATISDLVADYKPLAFLLRKDADDGLIAALDAPGSGWRRLTAADGTRSFDRGQAIVFVPAGP